MVRSCLMLALLLSCAGLAAAVDEKIDAKLLVGKWEPDKLPPGFKITIEFMKDDKLKIEVDAQGKQEKVDGTYKVEGDKLTIKMMKDGKDMTQTAKIIKLTEKECTIKDDQRGEEQTMKKLP